MAQRQVVQLIDDIDGQEVTDNGETISFALDGGSYEIDLNEKNAKKLRETFDFYITHARSTGRVGKASGPGQFPKAGKRAAQVRDYDPKVVRKWAESNNVSVPDRGRIPADVVVQFKEAGN